MSHKKSKKDIDFSDFYDLETVDDSKKKKKHKKKSKKCKGKKKVYKSKVSTLDKIADAVDVGLDTEIKISITDDTINKAIDTATRLIRNFQHPKVAPTYIQDVESVSKDSNDTDNK